MAVTMTTEKREKINEFCAGVQFSILHCDGHIAHETVSHITRCEERELKGRGFNQYYATSIYYLITCESCASYTLNELREAKLIKVA